MNGPSHSPQQREDSIRHSSRKGQTSKGAPKGLKRGILEVKLFFQLNQISCLFVMLFHWQWRHIVSDDQPDVLVGAQHHLCILHWWSVCEGVTHCFSNIREGPEKHMLEWLLADGCLPAYLALMYCSGLYYTVRRQARGLTKFSGFSHLSLIHKSTAPPVWALTVRVWLTMIIPSEKHWA